MDRERIWLVMCELEQTAARRQRAQGLVEFALLIVVLVAVASIGLGVLGSDLSGLFGDLGSKLKMPAGF